MPSWQWHNCPAQCYCLFIHLRFWEDLFCDEVNKNELYPKLTAKLENWFHLDEKVFCIWTFVTFRPEKFKMPRPELRFIISSANWHPHILDAIFLNQYQIVNDQTGSGGGLDCNNIIYSCGEQESLHKTFF